MKPTKTQIEKGLKQLVEIKFLMEKDGKYKFHPNYKKTLLKGIGNSTEELLLNALYLAGYFVKPKTEKEILVVCNLLTLKQSKGGKKWKKTIKKQKPLSRK